MTIRPLLLTVLILAIQPVGAADEPVPVEAQAAKLIKQLSSRDYATREAASRALEAIGAPALKQLEQAAKNPEAPAETRSRANQILTKIRFEVRYRAFVAKITKPTPTCRIVAIYQDVVTIDKLWSTFRVIVLRTGPRGLRAHLLTFVSIDPEDSSKDTLAQSANVGVRIEGAKLMLGPLACRWDRKTLALTIPDRKPLGDLVKGRGEPGMGHVVANMLKASSAHQYLLTPHPTRRAWEADRKGKTPRTRAQMVARLGKTKYHLPPGAPLTGLGGADIRLFLADAALKAEVIALGSGEPIVGRKTVAVEVTATQRKGVWQVKLAGATFHVEAATMSLHSAQGKLLAKPAASLVSDIMPKQQR